MFVVVFACVCVYVLVCFNVERAAVIPSRVDQGVKMTYLLDECPMFFYFCLEATKTSASKKTK